MGQVGPEEGVWKGLAEACAVRGVGLEPTFSRFQNGRIAAFLPPEQWTAGESHPDFRLATAASSCSTSSPNFQRSRRESNPDHRHTRAVCDRNTSRPYSTSGRNRTCALLDVSQVPSPLGHGG